MTPALHYSVRNSERLSRSKEERSRMKRKNFDVNPIPMKRSAELETIKQ